MSVVTNIQSLNSCLARVEDGQRALEDRHDRLERAQIEQTGSLIAAVSAFKANSDENMAIIRQMGVQQQHAMLTLEGNQFDLRHDMQNVQATGHYLRGVTAMYTGSSGLDDIARPISGQVVTQAGHSRSRLLLNQPGGRPEVPCSSSSSENLQASRAVASSTQQLVVQLPRPTTLQVPPAVVLHGTSTSPTDDAALFQEFLAFKSMLQLQQSHQKDNNETGK
jgi:hypothetical protein